MGNILNVYTAISRFNKMHDNVDVELKLEESKCVLNYGKNLIKMYKDTGLLDKIQDKVHRLSNLISYKLQ